VGSAKSATPFFNSSGSFATLAAMRYASSECERHDGYVFLRTGDGEGISFEVFERGDGWYWHARIAS
jgi:hypothetical protein